MLTYQLLLMAAAVVIAGCAGFLLSQALERRSTWLLAPILVSGAFWTGCELVASGAQDAESARFWLRLSAVGWVAAPTLHTRKARPRSSLSVES